MNKYQEALDYLFVKYENSTEEGSFLHRHHIDVIRELVDRATPMKPKIVKLFGDEITVCAGLGCGVGITKEESIFHKSKYCGNCGQRLDWSEE